MKEFYKDKFGDKTNQYYLTNKSQFKGTYNSDSVSNGKLGANLIFERDGEELLAFVTLFLKGKEQVKNGTSSGVRYDVSVKRSDGSQFTTSGGMSAGEDRIQISDTIDFAKALIASTGEISIYIEDHYNATNNYLFKAKCGNFKELYNQEVLIPYQEEKYQEAEELLKNKQFDEAAVAFEALGDYKDSADRVEEVTEAKNSDAYAKAEALLSQKKYDEAAKAFKALGDYKDSARRVEEITEAKNSDTYAKAEALLSQKKYDEAAKAFKALGDYKDSAARVNEVEEAKKADQEAKNADDYLKAEQLLKDKKYDQAAKAFRALGNYRDSIARMNEAVDAQNAIDYAEAELLYQNKEYDKAVAAFKALGDYKDSSTRALEVLEAEKKASITVGKTLTFGSYEQDDNLANGKEPIEWIVLEKQGEKAFVISKNVVTRHNYNDTWKSVTWETCTLRSWLNDEFFNTAFSKKEQDAILTTKVDNSKEQGNSDWYSDGGKDTEDKIYLLSYKEACTYFKTDQERGCFDYQRRLAMWLLRSPGSSQTVALVVGPVGQFISKWSVSDGFGSIRPVLWVDLEKIV